MFGFNAIFGFNIISPSLSLVDYDNEFEMKGKKFKPRIKLNHPSESLKTKSDSSSIVITCFRKLRGELFKPQMALICGLINLKEGI